MATSHETTTLYLLTLAGLREVLNSEQIVLLKSLVKENICFWGEGVRNNISNDNIYNMETIKQHVTNMENEIQEALSSESEEVAVYIYQDILPTN